MRIQSTSFVLCILLLFLAGCSQIKVSHDYDKHIVFSKYSSFNWQLGNISSRQNESNPLLEQRFHSAIETGLLNRGYTTSSSPDFLVSYTYSVTSKIQSYPVQPSFGFGYGRYGRHGGVTISSGADINQYDQGELIINIFDATTKKLAWRGKGTDVAPAHPSPEATSNQVNNLVNDVLDQFPPHP